MKSIIKYTLLTALRDWLFLGIFLLVMLATMLSAFLGSTAIAEQGMMSAAYIGGITRIIVIIGLTLFVCFHVRRSFENKEVELTLTRPISRTKFIISYFVGFMVLTLITIVPIVFMLYILSLTGLITLNLKGLLIWGVSFYLEASVALALAFFAAVVLSSAVSSVLFCFAFYFLSRIFGFFLISINNPNSVTKGSKLSGVMEQILNTIGIVIPRFDMLTKSEWLIYGINDLKQISLFLAAVLLYIPFILLMALFDFSKKQF